MQSKKNVFNWKNKRKKENKNKKVFYFYFYLFLLFYTHNTIKAKDITLHYLFTRMSVRVALANGANQTLLQDQFGPFCIPRTDQASRKSKS